MTPKSFYKQKHNSTLELLKVPEMEQTAKSMTLLQSDKTFEDAVTTKPKEIKKTTMNQF